MNKRTKKRIFESFRYSTLTIWLLIVAFPYSGSLARHLNQMLSGLHGHQFTGQETPTLANYANVWTGKEEYADTQYIQSMQKTLGRTW